MSDLYTITVLARDGGSVDLRVDIVHPDVVDVPLSRSFVAMIVEDEWAPGAAAYKAWWKAWVARDPKASPRPLYRSVELIDLLWLPREQSAPPAGMTQEELDALDGCTDPATGRSRLGSATLRVTVDDPGYVGHLEPGMSWSSTAWDEDGDGPITLGLPDDPRAWHRPG